MQYLVDYYPVASAIQQNSIQHIANVAYCTKFCHINILVVLQHITTV